MSYSDQIDRIVQLIRSGEKNPSEFSIGMEFEHFFLDKDTMEAISYRGPKGVEQVLSEMTNARWQPVFEQSHLIGLEKDNSTVTLEPGAQVELSTPPKKRLHGIIEDYFNFLRNINPILNNYDISFAAIGYQPVSSLDNISFIPKKRYEIMQKYLKTKGSHAHNMMKSTSSTQISIDYSSEQDYIKKNRVANYLAPLIYCIFDNAPYFEGKIHKERSMRSVIWDNCDPDRCGAPSEVFTDKFGYEAYAQYVLNTPAILTKKEGILVPTGDKRVKDIIDAESASNDDIGYMLTMVFPDTRTKTYIEIRMGDSMPYPYNFAYAAFWKGLLYNSKNLNALFNQAINYDLRSYEQLKKDVNKFGTSAKIANKSMLDTFNELLSMAIDGLDECEKKYLRPLISLTDKGLTLKDITINNAAKGVKESISWCILNQSENDGSCSNIACQ